MLNLNGAIVPEKGKVLFGISLVLTESFETFEDVVEFIQERYFEECGFSGFFRLMPRDKKHVASFEFLHCGKSHELNEFDGMFFEKSFHNIGSCCGVDILLGQQDFENLHAELDATTRELNEFVDNGYAESWEQFSLTENNHG